MNSKAVVSRLVAGTLVSSKAVQVGSKLKISASVCSSTVVKYLVFSNHVLPPSEKKAPPRTLLRTYSGILPKRHGILVERN